MIRGAQAYGARAAALLICLAMGLPAVAQDNRFNGLIYPRADAEAPREIDTLNDIGRAMQACWQPAGVRNTGQEVTVRLSFRRNGEVLGKPMITHYRAGEPDAENRQAFTQAVREALVRCSPMPFTDKLGAAVAGRPFTFRFIDAPAPQKPRAI